MTLAEDFDKLFAGRRDGYGLVEGGLCKEPLTLDVWQEHLTGTGSVGVYPIVDDMVHWGAVDIDLGDDLIVLAENLKKVLAAFNITAWIERSKGKGYHVFVFAQDWIPAATMRRALLVACDVAGVPPKEINPKQETLKDGEWGNYLNIPYAKVWAAFEKRVVLKDGVAMSAEDFARQALLLRNHVSNFTKVAALYKLPTRRQLEIGEVELDFDLSPYLNKIVTEGPLPDKQTNRIDRSNYLARVAHICKDEALTAEQAFAVLVEADELHGKFHLREDCEGQLLKLVENAYA